MVWFHSLLGVMWGHVSGAAHVSPHTISYLSKSDMSDNFRVLSKALIELSKGTTWGQAVLEWHPTDMWQEEDGTCTCGKYPILNHCQIYNPYTDQTLVVGSQCIKHFFDLPTVNQFFDGLARIRRDQELATPKAVVIYAKSVGWLSQGETGFLIKTHRKRTLSDKQVQLRRFLNRRILAKSLREKLVRVQ